MQMQMQKNKKKNKNVMGMSCNKSFLELLLYIIILYKQINK